jgi:YD repeat-containing protein
VGTFTNASGAQTANTWDKNNGESLSSSRQQAPTGAQVKATYNTAGAGLAYLPDTVTDSMGNASAIKYNGAGNLASNADALASMATIKSNADGTVDLSTDPMNVTNADPALQDRAKATQYAYNGTHQLTSITPPTVTPNSLGVRSFTYDGFGRLKTVLSARGVTTTYGYDALDRLRSETHSDPTIPTISYDYDANGNLFHRTDGSGITTLVSDAANRLTSKAIPGGPTLTYGYDPVGNLTSVGGDGRATPSIYQYDKLNLLEQLTEANGNRVVFAYNADGQRIDTWYAATYTDGLGVRYDTSGKVVPPNGFAAYIHSTLDTANKLTGIKTTRASSDTNVVADIGYSYDVVSPYPCPGTAPSAVRTLLRHSSTDNVTGAVTSYCYDGAARLTKAITTGGPTYTWAYDVDGNRTSGPEGTYPAVNSANQLTGPGTVTYDAQGNLVASPNVTSVYNGIDQASSITGGHDLCRLRPSRTDRGGRHRAAQRHLGRASGDDSRGDHHLRAGQPGHAHLRAHPERRLLLRLRRHRLGDRPGRRRRRPAGHLHLRPLWGPGHRHRPQRHPAAQPMALRQRLPRPHRALPLRSTGTTSRPPADGPSRTASPVLGTPQGATGISMCLPTRSTRLIPRAGSQSKMPLA